MSYEKGEPKIVECWDEAQEQVKKDVIRHTVQVMRIRHLEDYIDRPANGSQPKLSQKMYLPKFSVGLILRGHSANTGLSESRWSSDYSKYTEPFPHEVHWNEAGKIYTYVDDNGIEHQLATTCVWNNWMYFGSRALWVKAEHDADRQKGQE